MSRRLNWESALRGERMSRGGSEPFYRDLSPRGSTGTAIANDAFEQSVRRRAKGKRKRSTWSNAERCDDKTLDVRRALLSQGKLCDLLKGYVYKYESLMHKCTDQEHERLIMQLDLVVQQLPRGALNGPAALRIREIVASYVVTRCTRGNYMERYWPEGVPNDDDSGARPDVGDEVVNYVERRIVKSKPRNLDSLHRKVSALLSACTIPLKRTGSIVTNELVVHKHLVTQKLIARGALAVTPYQRVIYCSPYAKHISNCSL